MNYETDKRHSNYSFCKMTWITCLPQNFLLFSLINIWEHQFMNELVEFPFKPVFSLLVHQPEHKTWSFNLSDGLIWRNFRRKQEAMSSSESEQPEETNPESADFHSVESAASPNTTRETGRCDPRTFWRNFTSPNVTNWPRRLISALMGK